MCMVSIVVPVYNAETYIEACVDSIRRQSYSDWELLLIDDGSQDNSSTLLDEFAGFDRRITVVHTPNGGPSAARNTGIAISSAKYIMFVDADDLLASDYVEGLVTEVERYGTDVLYTNYDVMEGGRVSRRVRNPLGIAKLVNEGVDCYIRALYGDDAFGKSRDVNIASYASIYRAEIIRSNKKLRFPTDYRYYEDLMFNIRFCARAQAIGCSEISGYHLRRDGQASLSTLDAEKFDSIIGSLCAILDMASEEPRTRRESCVHGAEHRVVRFARSYVAAILGSNAAEDDKYEEFLRLANNPLVQYCHSECPSNKLAGWEQLFTRAVQSKNWHAVKCITTLRRVAVQVRNGLSTTRK